LKNAWTGRCGRRVICAIATRPIENAAWREPNSRYCLNKACDNKFVAKWL